MLSKREYEGNITTAHQVNAGLATYRALLEQRGKISAYCNLAVSEYKEIKKHKHVLHKHVQY